MTTLHHRWDGSFEWTITTFPACNVPELKDHHGRIVLNVSATDGHLVQTYLKIGNDNDRLIEAGKAKVAEMIKE